MKNIAYDSLTLEQPRIVEDSKCCLKVNAVITKVGVYPYPDGRALKSKMELLKAANTIRYGGAKLTILDHPESLVVMSQSQVYGGLENPYFERDKIRATLNFDKIRCTPEFIDRIRKAAAGVANPLDVSIGFYYQPDFTPGTWRGKPYDYIMRDIVIDHVAAGVLKGRCSIYDGCGIGVDSSIRGTPPRYTTDKVVKRGEQWCVIHCTGPDAGKAIKCFPTKEEAEAMHRAIQAKKDSWSQTDRSEIEEMSEANPDAGQTTQEQFNRCVSERIADGWNEKAAKDYCLAYTTTRDEPDIPANTQPPPSAPTGGASAETSQDQEEAEPADGETKEPTQLERCITNRMENTEDTEEQARAWCEAELAGEHAPASDMVERSKDLIGKYESRKIEKQRAARRHPL